MDDLARRVTFLEARLTLLERSFSRAFPNNKNESVGALAPGEKILIAHDQPGLLISRMYPSEYDEVVNNQFCWIGNDGPIQLVMPIAANHRMKCCIKLIPHPRVEVAKLKILVNDIVVSHGVIQSGDITELHLELVATYAPQISIVLTDLVSVRPSDSGENSDNRLLAARFLGAELTVL